MFTANKKLYFVFADEQDAFFTDSMLRLNPADYLWLMLRKSGYSNIFFIEETQNGLSLKFSDRDSAATYSKGGRKLSWKSRFNVPEAIETDALQLGYWVLRKKKREEGKTALVFQGTAFQKCFGTGAELLSEFLKWQKQSQDTVILLFPMCLSEREMRLFTSKKSVFAQMDGGSCLSRPIYDVIHAEGAVPIFDRLSEKLGDAMIQLGVFSYERICTMLRWAALWQGWDLSNEQFRDYANFLYWYVYSPELRAFVKEPLPRFGNGRELAECLLQEGILDTIDERLAVLRHKMPNERLVDILYQICPLRKDEDRSWVQITHDEQLLLRLGRMPFPADFVQINRKRGTLTYDFQKWLEMRRWVTSPNTRASEEKRMECICEFMEVCRKSILMDDMDTALRAARGISENALELYVPMGSQERFETYRTYLQLSGFTYEQHRRVMGLVGWMTEAQRQEAMQNNPTIKTAVNILVSHKQMLDRMTDAFLLPEARFSRLKRDAEALMNKMSSAGASEEPRERELTQEEKEKLFLRYEKMT